METNIKAHTFVGEVLRGVAREGVVGIDLDLVALRGDTSGLMGTDASVGVLTSDGGRGASTSITWTNI